MSHQRGRKVRFAALEFFLCGGIGLQIVIPRITRRFIDTAETGAPLRTLVTVATGFISASLIQSLVTEPGRYSGENLAWSATTDSRMDRARHALGLFMRYHNAGMPGKMIGRVDGDFLRIPGFFPPLVVMVGEVCCCWAESWSRSSGAVNVVLTGFLNAHHGLCRP